MCDSDYERFFRLKNDDDAELLFFKEDAQRQVMEVDDDDDDEDTLKLTFPSTHFSSCVVGNTGLVSPNGFGKDASASASASAAAAAQLKASEVNDLNAKFVPLQNVYTAPRTGEVMESHSFSSTHSRGYAQLSSSGTQTPTHASNEDLLRGSALLTAQAPHNEVGGMSTSLPSAQDVAAMPAQPQHQDEFHLSHSMLNNQAKQTYGVAPAAQSGLMSSSRISCSFPPTAASRPSLFSYAVVGPNPQIMAANALSGGALQPRQVMMSQQGVGGAIAQPVNIAQIQPASQHSLHTILPQPLLQQQQKQQQQPQLFQAHPAQQQLQAQYVTGAVPSGYAQLLVQTRSADGSGGYQLMMVPAHQVIAQGHNGASAQLLQPHAHHLQNTQQNQHMHNQHNQHHHQPQQPQQQQQEQQQPQPQQQQQQQQQPQAIMQQVWPLPQQGHGQMQQLHASAYANFAQTPQRCAVVSANGQQQYVMALTLPQFQQMQQAQAQAQQQQQQQQQSQRHFSLPTQPNQQQHMGQQIYFANQQQPQPQPQPQPQQQQFMFTNSFSSSGMPLTYGFN